MVKILVVGDLHGEIPKIHFKEFDCIIQPGDFSSDKGIRPAYNEYFQLLNELPDFLAPSFSEFSQYLLGDKELKKIEKEQMKQGREVLEYLNSFGKPVFVVPGNWDESYGKTRIKNMNQSDYNYNRTWIDWWLGKKINPYFTKGLKNIRDCQFKLHNFMGINFIGYGNSSGPERIKERLKEGIYTNEERKKLKEKHDDLYSRLTSLFKKSKKSPTIFISHNVPYGILDKIKDKKNYAYKKNTGSTVARDFVLKFSPLLCVGGHIHEYHAKKKLKNTTVINAGFGKYANTLIDINEKTGKIRKIKFYKK